MARSKTITIHRGSLKFSAGHFTVFSKTERETLHGHNYYIGAEITAALDQAGITFDYRFIREKLREICHHLNCKFMLPTQSPYVTIEQNDSHIYALFNGQKIPFLMDDVILLPIKNTTLEELSDWILAECLKTDLVQKYQISKIRIDVFNGAEQSSHSIWQQNETPAEVAPANTTALSGHNP